MTVIEPVASSSFYVTGGTLPPAAPSYVTRQADEDLYAALHHGDYAYVLNSRQMGKSSLCVRTIERLKQEGYRTAFVDLTRFGGKNLTSEQWYAGMLNEIGRALGFRAEFMAYWKGHPELSPVQRLFGAVQEVALAANEAPHVIFIDEIDVTRSLSFSTDEFFAAIRQLYVGRVTDPILSRLSICLLGTASPTELIQDTRVSPFNIGKRIDLRDFTTEEAQPLAQGLVGGQPVLDRVLYWTGGHPYLTQRLCRAITEEPGVSTTADVDRLCNDLFLSHRARESDDNLAFVRNRLLKSEVELAALLELYARMRAGKRVPDDETNPLCSVVKLSGVARVEDGLLKVRNRIYEHVFDRAWVVTHLPDADVRRQRQAFRRGLAFAGALSGVILAIMGGLAAWALHNAHRADANATLATKNAKKAARNEEIANANAQQAKRDADAARKATSRADASATEAKKSAALATQQKHRADDKAHLAAVKAHEAEIQRDEAQHLNYIANMNLIPASYDKNDFGRIRAILGETSTSKFRGFEWDYWHRLCHLNILELTGHSSRISALAFSADGKRIITGSYDSTTKVWDAVTGHEILTLKGHTDAVTSVAFSPDGKRIVTGSWDHTARVWDAVTGHEILTFKGHTDAVTSVAFSPDGKRILVGCRDGSAKVWDAYTGRVQFALKATPGLLSSANFSSDGMRIAIGGSYNVAGRIYDLASGREVLTLKRGSHGPMTLLSSSSAVFSPDAKRIVTWSNDNASLATDTGTVKVWDATTGREILTLKGHHDRITSVAFSADGERIATGSEDNSAKVWDAFTGQETLTFKGHEGAVTSVAFSPDGKRIVTGSDDKTTKIWDAYTGQETFPLMRHDGTVRSVAFSPDDKRIVTGRGDNQTMDDNRAIDIWDARTGQDLLSLQGQTGAVTSVAFSPNGKLMIVGGSFDHTAKVLDAYTGRIVLTLKGHGNSKSSSIQEFLSVAFSSDGKRIVTGGDDKTATVWDAITGERSLTLKGHGGDVTTVAFSPDGKRIVTGSWDKTAKIWDANTGYEILTLKGHSDEVTSVAFSPDSKRIVTGSNDRTAKIWDALTGRETLMLTGHSKRVSSVAFSPDGKRIVTGSDDQTAKVWDAAIGRATLELNQHNGAVLSVAFSSDGRRIATASGNIVNIWFSDPRDWNTAMAETNAVNGHLANAVLLENNRNYAEAIAECIAASHLRPLDASILGNLGWYEYLAGHMDDAIKSSRSALTKDSTLTYVKFNLGLCYAVLKDWPKAKQEYDQALQTAKKAELVAAIDDVQSAIKKQNNPALQQVLAYLKAFTPAK